MSLAFSICPPGEKLFMGQDDFLFTSAFSIPIPFQVQ